MRVSHVITRLIVGGAQENTASTVLGLSEKPDVQVELISGPSSKSEGTLEGAFDAHPGVLRILPSLVRPVDLWNDLKATRQLARDYRKSRPDIVHTHSGKAGVVGRLAARLAGVKCIVHTIHGPSFGPFQSAGANFVYRNAERFVGPFTTHFISVAQAMTDQYLAAGIGRPEQYTRIFSGFPLDPFLSVKRDEAMRAKLGIAPSEFVITKLARLFESKGHDDLFDAAPQIVKAIPNAKFLLIGEGPWREKFEQRAKTPELKGRVIFAGLVAPADVPKYLGATDVVVHLSYREGLPRAVSQSAAAGLPVIAYDCDGAKEVCLDGQNGFIIAQRDLAALTERLARLAGHPALRDKFGQTGREFVRENFGVQKMVDEIYALYRRLLGARS
ncbi:MAG TPA: glycosyltransferase family 4 protein [Verrucomicrobiae bacterium]